MYSVLPKKRRSFFDLKIVRKKRKKLEKLKVLISQSQREVENQIIQRDRKKRM